MYTKLEYYFLKLTTKIATTIYLSVKLSSYCMLVIYGILNIKLQLLAKLNIING